MIHVQLDAGQDRNGGSARYRLGYVLDGFVKNVFKDADFHSFTPSRKFGLQDYSGMPAACSLFMNIILFK
ncbi:hypothetical protein J21TS7_58740 [Paenibacillus cineris]|uniref:Uncharacterized protein n=1 Tax=Paenibacillus cineris TaxID=237530 RepID=A0ABQ4LM26_9BACL|nr:hypothetical protein J21TS7_58740 [Paenibacillus cineris]